MKHRIFFIISSLEHGGAEKVFSLLINKLDKNVFDCTIIVVNLKNYIIPINQGINVINLKKSRIIFAIPRLLQLIIKKKPDIVLTTLIPINTIVGLLIPYILFFSKKRTRFILRESSIPSMNLKFSKYGVWFAQNLIRLTYRNFDMIMTQSNDMANDLHNNFGLSREKIAVVNNPIIIHQLYEPRQSDSSSKKTVFITVGNLRPEKGHERILRVLYLLKDKIDFEYLIVGSGAEYEKLLALVDSYKLNKYVEFLGKKTNISDYLLKADFFLQGSYSEGFPNAILEANMCGVPVVAYNVLGGTKEIIIDGFNGFLVEDNNEKEYVEAILKCINHSFNKEEIFYYIKEKFEANKIVKKYEEIIKLCVE